MHSLKTLLEIMARLRDPEEGCPWDREQDFRTIAPYTIEEAYEVDDAIRRGDMEDLLSELGDLLLQVVYHSQLATEAGHFEFEQVVDGIARKLVRRHPHIFAHADASSRAEVMRTWERIKDDERSERGLNREGRGDPFDEIPSALPALMRAAKLQVRARRLRVERMEPSPEVPDVGVGDGLRDAKARAPEDPAAWRDLLSRLAELEVEAEVREADSPDPARTLGDALFSAVAWARSWGLDAEAALRDANARFEARIRSESRTRSMGEESAP